MRELLDQIERVAPSPLPVLLLGETGTGKEVLARALHAASGRLGPFVPVNCAALPIALAESELFGHVRGCFTGADRTRPGLFEQAHGGTLLLDEVAALSLAVQAKLLRGLEDGMVRRVGSNATVRVNVRLVCATNRLDAVDGREFRQDLYHRLAGLRLYLPPLSERPEDIGPLVAKFFAELTVGHPVVRLAEGTLPWLQEQIWPGNARQLRYAVQRAVLLGGPVLRPGDFRCGSEAYRAEEPNLAGFAGKAWTEIERDVLAWALRQYGNARAAARALGLPRSTLADRLQRRGLTGRSDLTRS